jgi:hypothetical protein
MDSGDIAMEQARQMHKSLFPLTNYLRRLVRRMERGRFPLVAENRRELYDRKS